MKIPQRCRPGTSRNRLLARSGAHAVCLVVCLALGAGSCGNGGAGSPIAPTRPVAPAPMVPDVAGQWSGALHVTRVTATGGWALGADTCEGMTECRTSAEFEPARASMTFMQTGRQLSGSLTFEDDFDSSTFPLQSGTVADTGAVTLTFGPQSIIVEEITVSLQPTGELQLQGADTLAGTVVMRLTTDILTGELAIESCLGADVATFACSGWQRGS